LQTLAVNWPTGKSLALPRAHIFPLSARNSLLRQVRTCALVSLMSLLIPGLAAASCQLEKALELPVMMSGLQPMISAQINDRDALFVLDSGAFYSMISAATAAEFNLKLSPAPWGMRISGIGGAIEPSVVTIKKFTLAGLSIPNIDFLVGGSEVGGAGLLGQNFLDRWDVEYDFAKGVMRLFRAADCGTAVLAYWRTPGQSYSMMNILDAGHGGSGSRRTLGLMGRRFVSNLIRELGPRYSP
jgi:predicted aspartyl protease